MRLSGKTDIQIGFELSSELLVVLGIFEQVFVLLGEYIWIQKMNGKIQALQITNSLTVANCIIIRKPRQMLLDEGSG